jgi:hypothetical protein
MPEDVWLRWFMVGFFALFGAAMIAARGCLGNVCSMVPAIPTAAQDRLHRALLHRSGREGFSRRLGVAIGACGFVLAALAARTAIPLTLLYAALAIALAFGFASLPALVGGDDVPVERFVDERVRKVRIVNLLGTSTAPVFVFFAFRAHWTALDGAATTFAFAILIASLIWQWTLILRPAPPREIASWSMRHA